MDGDLSASRYTEQMCGHVEVGDVVPVTYEVNGGFHLHLGLLVPVHHGEREAADWTIVLWRLGTRWIKQHRGTTDK